MPRDLGGLGDLMAMRALAEEMVDAVRAFKRGEADADHIEATFTRALGLGRPSVGHGADGRVERAA